MPAYRSADEAEIRDAVVARLRLIRPGARIIHEINVAGQGSNRIDVLAVDRAEIIAVEVKSKKDKIDRLPSQIAAMRGAAHHVVAALHEKFLISLPYRGAPVGLFGAPPEARDAVTWFWPETDNGKVRDWGCRTWVAPKQAMTIALPGAALDMLWADELRRVCLDLGVAVGARANMTLMAKQARGGELTKAICAALRRRTCIEADPAQEVA